MRPRSASWLVQHLGVSDATARAYAQVAEQVSDLPHLADGLSAGRLNLDKVRAVLGVATPENEAEWAEAAERALLSGIWWPWCAPRNCRLGPLTRPIRTNARCASTTPCARWWPSCPLTPMWRCALCSKVGPRRSATDGETPFDQRLADALVSLARAGGAGGARAPLVVAHVPLRCWADPDSALVGELEGAGLISADVVRRLLCDASVVVALDDALGHTMYEGRARRYPSETQRREVRRRDRHCVFPGCANLLFTNCHHIDQWEHGGRTDLGNLALLCVHHHHLIHSKVWSMEGDANVELRFVGPSGRRARAGLRSCGPRSATRSSWPSAVRLPTRPASDWGLGAGWGEAGTEAEAEVEGPRSRSRPRGAAPGGLAAQAGAGAIGAVNGRSGRLMADRGG